MPATCSAKRLLISLSKTPISLLRHALYATLSKSQPRVFVSSRANICDNDSHLLHCLSRGDIWEARQVIDQMPQRGNRSFVVALTSLLSKFAKDGFVNEARTLFDIMPERNVVTYNAMLSGYVQSGRLAEACRFFEEMPVKNVVSWTSMLCGLMNCGMVEEGKRLFEDTPEKNVVTWNSMVVGLVKNGDLEGARSIFDVMPTRDSVSWNAMIDGYVENDMMKEAKALFDLMEDKNVVTWTTLIAGYCRAGEVGNAYDLFLRMAIKNVVSWTAMISGFSWNGYYEEAISLFIQMSRTDNIKPNQETLTSLTYACAGLGFPRLGLQVHGHSITNGWEFSDDDGRLSNSLVYMYSRVGLMEYASSIFMANSRNWTMLSCNAMINGYLQIGQLDRSRYIFDIIPVHDKISWTSIITGYLSSGQVAEACRLFNDMPDRDAIAWTAMISGFVQNELFVDAMYLFSEMQMQGIMPLESTYSALLGAAGAMTLLDQGKQLHGLLMKRQTNLDLILENSLISMYAKCGQVDDAYRIFSSMASRDLVSWNSMIMGYSYHGLAHDALSLFASMTESRIKPSSVTFLGILSACSHAGLIDEGGTIYRAMSKTYGIEPDVKHHICMINLLGRTGNLEEAEQFVLSLPSKQGVAIWGALLGICGLNEGNAEIASHASLRLLELDPVNAPAHIVLCNMHATVGKYGEEGILRKEMRLKGMRKLPGCSWISSREKIHAFLSGDRPQPQKKKKDMKTMEVGRMENYSFVFNGKQVIHPYKIVAEYAQKMEAKEKKKVGSLDVELKLYLLDIIAASYSNGQEGVEKMEVDASKGTLTIVGEVEPVPIFKKLTKIGKTPEIVSVGPPPPKCGPCCTCSLCRPYVMTKCEPWCTCSLCRPYLKRIPPYPSQYFPSYSKQCELVDVSYPAYSDDTGQCSIL
ncbi:hypothetical protein Cgig2_002618 [Carnegiea gigantea]|uniref:Uncharacterized protein n=1 Tax=Carnegiea gigantea TaxID=171969 RepID=A0A9Q1QAM0_9CARY|nr:hypothetical protein Cgig2_002618 [Carnegiea gigantea]